MESTISPIPFDYHSHHYRCGHAAGQMRDYVDAAIAQGMTEFGVSDHGPAYFLPGDHAQPGTQMAGSEFPCYVAEAKALQAEYAGRIAVKVGVEADFIEDRVDDLREVLQSVPLDYTLGSVHYVHGISVFHRERWLEEDPETTYAEYYRLVQTAARCGLFDTLSHLTVIEVFGPPVSPELEARLYPPVADAIAEAGCLVEINTSGYRKMGGDEPFPNRRMLRELIRRGVPITYGSDCHKPEEVGFAAAKVRALLAESGIQGEQAQPFRTLRGQTLQAFRAQ